MGIGRKEYNINFVVNKYFELKDLIEFINIGGQIKRKDSDFIVNKENFHLLTEQDLKAKDWTNV